MADTELDAALTDAIATGRLRRLRERMERSSNLPGRPNLPFAELVGSALARRPGGEAVVRALAEAEEPFGCIVAAFACVARSSPRAVALGAREVEVLEFLAGRSERIVREGVVHALRRWLGAVPSQADVRLASLAEFADGFLHAAVLLEVLSERSLLDAIGAEHAPIEALERAYRMADETSRSEERLQGVRELRIRLEGAIAALAMRYPGGLTWLEAALTAQRPETRAVLTASLDLLAKRGLRKVEVDRLRGLLAGSAKPLRDAARVVEGTRKRGGGRRR